MGACARLARTQVDTVSSASSSDPWISSGGTESEALRALEVLLHASVAPALKGSSRPRFAKTLAPVTPHKTKDSGLASSPAAELIARNVFEVHHAWFAIAAP